MDNAGPVIVTIDPGTCNLVQFLQLMAADLAYLSILGLDLAVIADY